MRYYFGGGNVNDLLFIFIRYLRSLTNAKYKSELEIKDFYDFTPDDVRLDDYVTGPQIKNIPIAV